MTKQMKALLALGGIAAIMVIISTVIWSLSFRITGTSPKNGNKKTATSTAIEVRFSKKLAGTQPKNVFTISPAISSKLTIYDKKISLNTLESLKENTTYKITITDATSASGKKISKVITFKTAYVAFGDRAPDEQQAAIDQSDSLQTQYPILKYIPHDTEEYKIDYVLADKPTGKQEQDIILTITMFAIFNRPEQYTEFKQQTVEYRANALKYLEEKGFDISKFKVTYLPQNDKGVFIGDTPD